MLMHIPSSCNIYHPFIVYYIIQFFNIYVAGVHSRIPPHSSSARVLWISSLKASCTHFPKAIFAILPFKIFWQKKFYGTAQNRLTPILPTLACLSPTCNFTKIQKVCDFCRYWLKRKNTPYGKANLAIRCILIISHFP